MKIQQAVWKETRKIAIGVSLLSCLMILGFIGLGYFDYTVPLGALLGTVSAVGNFFLMALTVQQITQQIHGVKKNRPADVDEQKENKPEATGNDETEEDTLTAEEQADLREQTLWAKKKMQRSHALRMVMMVVIAIIGLKISCFHPVAVMVPFLFPRIVILLNSFIEKRKGV